MFKKLIGFAAIMIAILAVGWLALKRSDIPYATLEAAYGSSTSKFVTLSDNVRVHYRDTGLIEGPTIVLVHGFSSSLHTWQGWERDLSADHRVISLDLPAHGLTRSPEGYPAQMDNFVKVIDELTEFLGAESFAIAGSSMGGNASWEFALAHPEKTSALILVGASGWPESDADISGEPFIFKLLSNPVARTIIKDIDMKLLIRGGLKDSFVDERFVTDQMVERYSMLSRAPGRRGTILEMMANTDARRHATEGLMQQIKTPTLVLHGDGDALVPVQHGSKFHAHIEGAELVIYENVGHLPQEEVTEQSLQDLREFLESLKLAADEAEISDGVETQLLPASEIE